ncbi:hypothetical protein QJS04_geneDACA003914 [Acorus gramineus]|uniref:Uncharacterized protein n=1 Tax=Acorus gramineus TaxID=55184 RepID=A0AAV9BGK4_ACOGR|nr:hypothetical protein QJS04_geneDACA003914 [Acorus gramineus]
MVNTTETAHVRSPILYVGDLYPSVAKSDLASAFPSFRDIASVRVCKDRLHDCSHRLSPTAFSSLRGAQERFDTGGFRRWFANLGTAPEERIAKYEEEDRLSQSVLNEEIGTIRREFEVIKRSFLNIPAALRETPKMNPEGIYVNKNLRLDTIQVYGFDYDYTLAHYSPDLQTLIYDLAKEHLVNELRYPESCLRFKYDPSFPIRGLYYDSLKGCLLKLDFFGSIEPDGCFFGRRRDCCGNRDSWRELFDVVIAQANKPSFYTLEHPFRCYDAEKDTLAFTAVDAFLPNQIYYHGCLKSFLQITKWNGPEVIYFGDHLFSDLRGPSKAGWRTAAIIHELENEIQIQNEESYRFQQAKLHILQELLGKFHATVANSQCGEDYYSLLNELNGERQRARSIMRSMFNSSFGATFLTDTGQESAFAYNIHQYADVYTSKAENFLHYPAEAWFHVPYDIKIMPHHVKVSLSKLLVRLYKVVS